MSMKNMVTVGFLSMVVVVGVAGVSDSAAETQRVNGMERVGVGGSTYSSGQPDGADACAVPGVNGTERIGHGGSTYPSNRADGVGVCHVVKEEERKVDIIERIGHGGSTYSFSHSNAQIAGR